MAAKKPATRKAAKTSAKRTAPSRPRKAAARKAAPERAAWIGVSKPKMRMGQHLSVSWRVAGEPHEFVTLWQEGPDGDFHWSVPPKGSRGLQALTPGKYSYSVHGDGGKELARVEVVVAT